MEEITAEWIRRHLGAERGAQAKMSRATGIKPDHLNRIIKGNRQIKAHEIPLIYRYFFPDPQSQDQHGDDGWAEFQSLWHQLTPEEQTLLKGFAKGQIASRGAAPAQLSEEPD